MENYERAVKLFGERGEYCTQADAHAMVRSQYVWDCGDLFRATRDATDRSVSYAISVDVCFGLDDDQAAELLAWDHRSSAPPSWIDWAPLAGASWE